MKNESQHDKMTDTGALRELLVRATPGPMRECGHDRGGCVCGLVFSLSEEIPVADFGLSGDEELRHARPGGEHRKANAALYAAAISVLPSMLDELDAARNQLIYAEAALAGETAQREHYSAYGITHNGMLLYCSSGMRDAYSELRVELDAARARIAELEKDAGRIGTIASEYWRVESFAMPTPGGDDADVGWRIVSFHCGKPSERIVVEHYEDDLRAAIDAAMARDGEGSGTGGAGTNERR